MSVKSKLKILVVDDSDLILKHVCTLLADREYEPIAAQNLPIALDSFNRYRPQAILIDFILGDGKNGLEVISAIFALCDSQKPTPMPHPAAAVLTKGKLPLADQAKADSLKIPVIQKPSRGNEEDFVQNIGFWLHGAKLE